MSIWFIFLLGFAKDVYEGLVRGAKETGAYRVFRSADIPKEFHYSNSRTPPILLLANPPHTFQDFYDSAKYFGNKYNFKRKYHYQQNRTKIQKLRPPIVPIAVRLREVAEPEARKTFAVIGN